MKKYVTNKLYDALYNKHAEVAIEDENPDEIVKKLPACFRPTLCRYQAHAVNWLCKREQKITQFPNCYNNAFKEIEENAKSPIKCGQLPPGGILADEMGLGKTVEILALILLNPRASYDYLPPQPPLCFAATLAKRACLSKVVFCVCGSNVLAKKTSSCIQCSKCEKWQHIKCVCKFNSEHDECINTEPYMCPQCWSEQTMQPGQLVPSRATFIISPNAIKLQWLSEIRKHIHPSLRVLIYNGISKSAWISPRQLANYDVVLTDYTVLCKEIHHKAENTSNIVRRQEPRFMRVNTPLLMVEWWRVCLDEAQMVELNASNMAKLAFCLPAINRWAVTGTPIQNSIDDLHSLLSFIGFNEICYPRSIWNSLVGQFLSESYFADELGHCISSALIDSLQLCMWRTCKSKVDNELNIPRQSEQVHYITLSNLEKLFYSEQHADCEDQFNENFKSYIERAQKYGLNNIAPSPKIMKIFLAPLLKLRQCCSMPVVISGSGKTDFKNANNPNVQKKFLQPKELHTHLKSANEMECKSELRSMASSYNGLAGIYFIQKNYEESIRHYELVLKLANDYEKLKINVDSLLQIHALHNILQVYNSSAITAKKVSADTVVKYEEQCNQLEWKYLEPYASQMKRVQEAYAADVNAYKIEASQTETHLLNFISELCHITLCHEKELHEPLMDKIFDECVRIFTNCAVMQEMTSMRSVLYVLQVWHGKLVAVQKSLIKDFGKLAFFTDNVRSRNQVSVSIWRDMMQFVNKVYDCHLSEIRAKNKDKKKEDTSNPKANKTLCDLCIMRDKLNSYECILFNKVIDKETNLTEGLAIPSPHITLVKVILNFAKSKHQFQSLVTEFDKHLDLISSMQTMWKKMLKFWIEIEYTVKAYDELDMCKMRISLTDDEDERSNFKLMEHELDTLFLEQQTNLYTAQREFAVKFARLKYILHLEANADPGPCPICQSDDESRYAVLECGHHVCLCCLKAMKQFYKTQKLTCSICRNQQTSERTYFVTRTTEQDSNEFDIKGDYSTKISYIVRQILKLQKDAASAEEAPKVLIFSQWDQILVAIGNALSDNGIRHRVKWSPQALEDFKNPHMGITCMLMALARGSKGLNLVEATHVFLVEPILNPAEELQAIGRVHRFGQTKPTTVHRFIVVNTIEENIFYTVTRGKDTGSNWEFENMSLESLRDLFNLENDVHTC